ncbi:unnamed protein product [Ectocarpus sp. 12 AP-2014]
MSLNEQFFVGLHTPRYSRRPPDARRPIPWSCPNTHNSDVIGDSMANQLQHYRQTGRQTDFTAPQTRCALHATDTVQLLRHRLRCVRVNRSIPLYMHAHERHIKSA